LGIKVTARVRVSAPIARCYDTRRGGGMHSIECPLIVKYAVPHSRERSNLISCIHDSVFFNAAVINAQWHP